MTSKPAQDEQNRATLERQGVCCLKESLWVRAISPEILWPY